jgi:hypothetical protein
MRWQGPLMSLVRPHVFRLLCIAAALATVAGTGRFAPAQDDHERDDDAEPGPAAVARAVERVWQPRARLEYGQQYSQRRALLELTLDRELAIRLENLESCCQLTQAQARKLTLAAHFDMKRFMDRWDPVARKLFASELDPQEERRLVVEWKDLQIELHKGVLGEDSVFGKTLRRTLDPYQAERLKRGPTAVGRPSYETVVRRAVDALRRNLELSAQQAADLRRLIMKETRSPKQFGNASDEALVVFQISRLPEQTVKTLLDGEQWRLLSHWMAAYKQGSAGEDALKRHGFIFDDTPVPRPVAPDPATGPKRPEV